MEPQRRSRRVYLALALLVLVPAALEVGARVVDRVRGSPWDGERSRASVAAAHKGLMAAAWPEGRTDRTDVLLQPFTGWQPSQIQARIADDLDEYRMPESIPVFDVCLLGGSGAAALASEGGAGLVGALARDPRLAGREIRLHAYGIEGTKQPQAERLLAYLLSLGHRPDAVIEFDGLDEASMGWSNALAGVSPLYPSAEIWGNLTEGLRFDWEVVELLHELREAQFSALELAQLHMRLDLHRSCFLDHAARLLLDRRLGRIEDVEAKIGSYAATRSLEAELAGPRTSTEPADVARVIVSSWEEASIDMHAMCERRGIAYLQVLEPAGPGADAGVDRVHPGLREAGRRLAERGIAFLDGAAVLGDRPEELFDGAGRLGDRGLEILAESAARALPVR